MSNIVIKAKGVVQASVLKTTMDPPVLTQFKYCMFNSCDLKENVKDSKL